MKKKFLLFAVLIALIFPGYSAMELEQAFSDTVKLEEAENLLNFYRISIWISWIIIVAVAVYQKWTEQKNRSFIFTYGYLVVAFAVFGYYTQLTVTTFELPTRFEDNYSLGVFTALQNLLAPIALTAFLQICVWWFTRRLHRR